MNKEVVVRAWKDPEFREHLSKAERAALPESPSGKPLTELGEDELGGIAGGFPPNTAPILCQSWTQYRLCRTGLVACTSRSMCMDNC